MSNHTLGPWNWLHEGSTWYLLSPDQDHVVLEICLSFSGGSVPEEADASLISAAPELLAALHGFGRDYIGARCFCELSIGNPMYRAQSKACLAARAAIAKAEGKG